MEGGKYVMAGLIVALMLWLEHSYRRFADRLALYEEYQQECAGEI